MNSIYKLLMILSQDFLDVYRYILNKSMKHKDYEKALENIDEVQDGVKLVQQMLVKHQDNPDYDLFYNHSQNIKVVSLAMIPIVTGLRSKAEHKGKYGILNYIKDIKNLDRLYDLFEITGNDLNLKASEYSK